jgi:hypothetical protein
MMTQRGETKGKKKNRRSPEKVETDGEKKMAAGAFLEFTRRYLDKSNIKREITRINSIKPWKSKDLALQNPNLSGQVF